MRLPNKRLTLAGAGFQGKRTFVHQPADTAGASRFRPPALAPQLKRDPLGGALPPRKHSSVMPWVW